MTSKEKKYLGIFAISTIVTVVSASIPEMGLDYFKGYDGLGRAVHLMLFVTVPAAIVSFVSLVAWLVQLFKRREG